MKPERIVVIGGGIAGLATAWNLAEKSQGKRRVTLLEAESAFGRPSSGRSASILRTASVDPINHEWSRRGAQLLRSVDRRQFDGPLVDPRGLLLTADASHADKFEQALGHLDGSIRFERLERPRLPYDRREAQLGAHFPDEGRIWSERLIAGLATSARRAGVELRPGTQITELALGVDVPFRLRIKDGDAVEADRVVIAAGGWAEELGRAAGSSVTLQPTRRHIGVFGGRGPVPADAPVVWHLGNDEFYYRPEGDGLLVCACDQTRVSAPPPLDPGIEETLIRRALGHLNATTARHTTRLWSGCRTMTTDGRFCIGPDPGVDGLFWVAGLGGAGMTAGLEVGRLAARWIEGSNEDRELARASSPSRLSTSSVTK